MANVTYPTPLETGATSGSLDFWKTTKADLMGAILEKAFSNVALVVAYERLDTKMVDLQLGNI